MESRGVLTSAGPDIADRRTIRAGGTQITWFGVTPGGYPASKLQTITATQRV
jgi:hypothetical protein